MKFKCFLSMSIFFLILVNCAEHIAKENEPVIIKIDGIEAQFKVIHPSSYGVSKDGSYIVSFTWEVKNLNKMPINFEISRVLLFNKEEDETIEPVLKRYTISCFNIPEGNMGQGICTYDASGFTNINDIYCVVYNDENNNKIKLNPKRHFFK